MNRRSSPPCLALALLVLGWLMLVCGQAAAQEDCISGKCHATLLKGDDVHPVAGSCEGCHEAVSTPHPQKGKTTFKLVQEPPDLCYTCHEAFGTKSQVHPPVKDGMCTMCHNPHSSNQPKLLRQPLKDLCTTCHADQVDFKFLHGPVSAGDCTACHTPHEADNQALLLKEPPALCEGCHTDMEEVLKKKNVHPALAGGCTTCHNPHGAAHPKLLADEVQQVCFTCHPDIADKVNDSAVPHPAVLSEDSCVSCHSPHASDNDNLLLNPEKETCLSCHPDILTDDMKVFHGPINKGKCTPCHQPHGSQYRDLLMKNFPPDEYVPYTDNAYPLCFSCHKRDMVQYAETSFATNFRDGERNLHYLHVHKAEKGRSCRMCHVIHGSAGPKLIAKTVPFGQWQLPLNFVKTETGGGCSPGCHKPQYYDRKSPGRRPKGVKSAGREG